MKRGTLKERNYLKTYAVYDNFMYMCIKAVISMGISIAGNGKRKRKRKYKEKIIKWIKKWWKGTTTLGLHKY